jgi:ribosomal protein L11 methyltransferase
MYSLALICPQTVKDIVVADLWECGTLGITENDVPGSLAELRAFFDDSTGAAPLLEQFSAYAPEIQPENGNTDWQRELEQSWPVLEVGRRFFVVPVWSDVPAPEGRLRLVVHPGMAFGTGTHETTQLVLETLETYLRAGERVLDLGCGSGILSEAAHQLGAGLVVACDIDPDAVAVARQNSRAEICFFTGSARAVRSESIDFTVANINAETIVNLAGELRRLVRPSGRAALSGFLHSDASRVRGALEKHGFTEAARLVKGDWVCLLAARLAGRS